MTTTAIRLTDPVSGLSVPIMPRDGISAQQIDASAPARAVTEPRVGARGGVDTTANLDEGALSLSLLLWPGITTAQTPEGFMDEIAPLLDPRLRPALIVSNSAWAGDRRAVLRFDSKAAPNSDPSAWPVQLNFAVPGACWEDAAPVTAIVGPLVVASIGLVIGSTGLVVTSAGVTMPASAVPTASQVVSAGTMASQWTALVYGPCTGPKLANDIAGAALEFTDDVVLGAGEYLLLSSQDQTALRNGDPAADVTGSLSFATSNWWLIAAGLNLVRFYPSSAGPGSQAQITFRGAYPL